MPNLPTINVTQAQADRILSAFKAKYGTETTADTVAAYQQELVEQVTSVVMQHEQALHNETLTAKRVGEMAAIREAAGLAAEPPIPLKHRGPGEARRSEAKSPNRGPDGRRLSKPAKPTATVMDFAKPQE